MTRYPYRVPPPPTFLERHPLLVPLLLVFATLINWG